jgi:hypothetical protein
VVLPLPALRDKAVFSFARSRCVRLMSSLRSRLGTWSTRARNSREPTSSAFTAVFAMTLAVRGEPSSRAISPTWSPGPSSAMTCPSMTTSTSPDRMTMNS